MSLNLLLRTILILLALTGIFDSLALSVSENLSSGVCLGGGSCDQVLASKFATILGIHWSDIGLAAYTILFISALCHAFGGRRLPLLTIVFGSFFGVLISTYLIYLQAFRIEEWCPLCLLSAGLQLALLITSIWLAKRTRSFGHADSLESPTEFQPSSSSTTWAAYLLGLLILTSIYVGKNALWEKAAPRSSSSNLIATIGSENLYQDKHPELAQLHHQFREKEWETLKYWFQDHLVEKYAAEKGFKERADLIDSRYASVKKVLTDDDIRKFYDEEYRSTSGVRLPYQEAKEEIRYYLEEQQFSEFEYDLVEELKEYYVAQFHLPRPAPPYVEMNINPEDVPVLGNLDAPIMLVQFVDFACPYCRRVQEEIRKVRAQYPDQVAVAFRFFHPTEHKYATSAARAALAAQKQGKFWDYTWDLFEKQGDGIAKDETYLVLAKKWDLDLARFNHDRHSAETTRLLERDSQERERCYAPAPPCLFVNGHRIAENPTAEAIIAKIKSLNL